MIERRELKPVPQIKLPSSNTKIASRNTPLRRKNLYALPQRAWKAAVVRKNADPYYNNGFS